MSFSSRVASLAALSLGMLGLGTLASASQAAETAAVVIPATLPAPADLPMLSAPALPASGNQAVTAAPHFASLEEAVTAWGGNEGTGPTDEVACLAGAIYFEAKGEPLSGQLAVANVILNRARSGRFPSDVCGVVTQRGQFSFVHDGHLPAIDAAARGYRTAVAMARVALAEAWDSPAPQALFFHARRVGAGRGTQVAAIGNHVFYR